jgi:hypothetical protein
METVWFAIVSAMLAVYVVLDGFDFGVGILHRFVAKNDVERRSGWWRPAACCSWHFPRFIPPPSVASTWP